ncbi:DUF3613 domain-containing protein [Variovorax boronicumulans]|uniref:DUF3613 domain-containing protein n=1 Tax=Variovorax boronicumulans TaxID=436515 RepID=UPI001C596865
MTHLFSLRTCAPCSVALLAAFSIAMPLPTAAQQEVAPDAQVAAVEPQPALSVRLQVGDATHNLLAMQREGNVASTIPRPLAGDVATLSYQRYLDSFKFPIPEKFSATVQKSGSGSR